MKLMLQIFVAVAFAVVMTPVIAWALKRSFAIFMGGCS